MALIANYTDLKALLSEWLGRTGDTTLDGRADAFIQLFEAEFTSDPEMRTFEMEEVDTHTITAAASALPTGFLEMIRLQVAGVTNVPNRVLTYITPQRAALLDAQQASNSAGASKFYTVLAGQIFLCPQKYAPTGALLEMAYYKFAPLSVTNTTNWLLTNYPNIYLYGSLMQAAAYIDDKDTVAQWAAGMTSAIAKLGKSDRKRKIGSGPLSVGASASFIR